MSGNTLSIQMVAGKMQNEPQNATSFREDALEILKPVQDFAELLQASGDVGNAELQPPHYGRVLARLLQGVEGLEAFKPLRHFAEMLLQSCARADGLALDPWIYGDVLAALVRNRHHNPTFHLG